MKRRRTDTPLTVALSLSLAAHAGLGLLFLRARIAELTQDLYHPPITAAELIALNKPEPPEGDDPPLFAEPPPQTVGDFARVELPKPPPTTPPPQKPKPQPEENSEWGEKDATGIAVTSSPGKQDLAARKGNQDQSFASRDPEGPQLRPDEPSMSTALPGQNGDGKRAMQQAGAALEKPSDPSETIGNGTTAPMVPPPPTPQRPVLARDDRGTSTPDTSGRSASRTPSVERRSPAESNAPPADHDGLPNDLAWGDAAQLLPIKRPDFIAIRSSAPAYPEVVAALTRPPGLAMRSDPLTTLDAPVLPSSIAADSAASPAVQVATSPIDIPRPKSDETALRVGETVPVGGPAVVEALTHPPDSLDLTGGGAALPEVVAPLEPSGPTIADAILGAEPERPPVEELAQRVETPAPPTPNATASKDAPPPTAAPASTAVANARGGLPGPSAEAADPAPDTARESDPFAKIPAVEFRDGKVAARDGRQIKPVRPRLSEIAQRDLLGLQFPTILAKVRIDKTGKVTDVTLLRGSGSEAVDQPVYRALWNWWFEPPKDKKGNPLEDVQLVSIHWG